MLKHCVNLWPVQFLFLWNGDNNINPSWDCSEDLISLFVEKSLLNTNHVWGSGNGDRMYKIPWQHGCYELVKSSVSGLTPARAPCRRALTFVLIRRQRGVQSVWEYWCRGGGIWVCLEGWGHGFSGMEAGWVMKLSWQRGQHGKRMENGGHLEYLQKWRITGPDEM